MSNHILLTAKLHIQPLRVDYVARPHLIRQMNEGLEAGCRLTLISAPAGFGKTMLVSEWVAGCGRPVAWLSLDPGDNDPARFITYLIKALQTIRAGTGEGLLAALQSPQPLQIDAILVTLLNEIAAFPDDFILVLDDYHAVDSQAVDQLLVFIIEHQPEQMHLVIATREDPSLPLARLRARGQCTELRAADLRFSPAEAAEFLTRVMALDLTADDISALEARTEGWIAGLQLAAISMRGRTDAAGFVQSFSGSHRFVMDYLLEEVLNQQPADIQKFLLHTSVLERMCAPLCDAILPGGTGSGQTTLEYLERANLFVVPQDNERRWYRYHHLFGDLLRKRLGQSLDPEGIARLHVCASEWYENNGVLLDAFHHAVAANDIERAMRLMESSRMPLHQRGTATTILAWLESLPGSVRNARPLLWWKQAYLLLITGQTVGVEEKLQAAEAALAEAGLDDAARDLVGRIAAARANLAQTQAQIDTILVQTQRALEHLHPGSLSYRSWAIRALAFAHAWNVELDEASRSYTEALSLAQAAGDIVNTTMASIGLGQVSDSQIQLHRAAEIFQHVLQQSDDYSPPSMVLAHLGLSQAYYQWNDLEMVERYARQGLQLAQQYGQIPDRIIMSILYLGMAKLARRDAAGADEYLSQANQISHQKNYTLRLTSIVYLRALVCIQRGDLEAAAELTHRYDIPLMQARVLTLQHDPAPALEIIERLLWKAEEQKWPRRILDVMTMRSIALYAHGEIEKALAVLGDVLAMAEPEGFIRLFLDEGPLMAELLSVAASRGMRQAYVNRLLAAFQAEIKTEQAPSSLSDLQDPRAGSPLVEPLSPRELEVLQLIAAGLSNHQIGARLFLALDTVKGHNRRIFEKLHVQRRTEAIARARELGLI